MSVDLHSQRPPLRSLAPPLSFDLVAGQSQDLSLDFPELPRVVGALQRPLSFSRPLRVTLRSTEDEASPLLTWRSKDSDEFVFPGASPGRAELALPLQHSPGATALPARLDVTLKPGLQRLDEPFGPRWEVLLKRSPTGAALEHTDSLSVRGLRKGVLLFDEELPPLGDAGRRLACWGCDELIVLQKTYLTGHTSMDTVTQSRSLRWPETELSLTEPTPAVIELHGLPWREHSTLLVLQGGRVAKVVDLVLFRGLPPESHITLTLPEGDVTVLGFKPWLHWLGPDRDFEALARIPFVAPGEGQAVSCEPRPLRSRRVRFVGPESHPYALAALGQDGQLLFQMPCDTRPHQPVVVPTALRCVLVNTESGERVELDELLDPAADESLVDLDRIP